MEEEIIKKIVLLEQFLCFLQQTKESMRNLNEDCRYFSEQIQVKTKNIMGHGLPYVFVNDLIETLPGSYDIYLEQQINNTKEIINSLKSKINCKHETIIKIDNYDHHQGLEWTIERCVNCKTDIRKY